MPHRIVYFLEIINIENEHHRPALRILRYVLFNFTLRGKLVIQSRQKVRIGLFLKLLLFSVINNLARNVNAHNQTDKDKRNHNELNHHAPDVSPLLIHLSVHIALGNARYHCPVIYSDWNMNKRRFHIIHRNCRNGTYTVCNAAFHFGNRLVTASLQHGVQVFSLLPFVARAGNNQKCSLSIDQRNSIPGYEIILFHERLKIIKRIKQKQMPSAFLAVNRNARYNGIRSFDAVIQNKIMP